MLTVNHVLTSGWEPAIRGMRNPLNSWKQSDSMFPSDEEDALFRVGMKDLDLMNRLANGGPDDRKFMRMIQITMDIVAPMYWWKEFDTYKVGSVRNSCSTMHTIHKQAFTPAMFSCEKLGERSKANLLKTIGVLNSLREQYIADPTDKGPWYEMIQLLPSSFNQRSTVSINYEVARNMYHARKNHKLDEWHTLCRVFEHLPCAKELIKTEQGKE